MSNVATMEQTDRETTGAAVDPADIDFQALEDADTETKTDGTDYDLGRDEIYETDLLDEESDLDMDRDPGTESSDDESDMGEGAKSG